MSALSDLDPCEPGTVTPLCTAVVWEPPDPEVGNPWFPVPVGTWNDGDGLNWPPRTPGTHHPHDVEVDSPR